MSKFTVYISQEARVLNCRTVEAANEAEAKDIVLEAVTGSPWLSWEIEPIGWPQVDDICERKDSE
tara:strand:- start:36 stop:230 length:195 start_codon:yes stop_codon:yes gene_type:complete